MALLLAMEEATTEWCPRTDRRVLAWLIRHAAVLGGTVTPSPAWDHEALFRPPDHHRSDAQTIAGFPTPGDPTLNEFGDPMWQHLLHANWDAYCERLPTTAAHRFYVEPGSQWLPRGLVMASMPYRTLVVARDPRSELAELWTECRRTGVLPSTLTHVDTPMSFAEREANHRVRDRLRELGEIQQTPERMRVRYEDVIERPAEVWQQLRAWLLLPERQLPAIPPTGHEWTPSRWRSSLTQDVDAVYRAFMAPQMEALGYEL